MPDDAPYPYRNTATLNERYAKVAELLELARVAEWRLRFHKHMRDIAGNEVDMYAVHEPGDPSGQGSVSIAVAAGDAVALEVFRHAFEMMPGLLAGGSMVLNMFELMSEMTENLKGAQLDFSDQESADRFCAARHEAERLTAIYGKYLIAPERSET